jgi:hypothetical protein
MPDYDTMELNPEIPEAPPAVINMDYDTPPPEFVAGTVVPKDTPPEDMSNAEYIQWMYDNLTPFWAIKKNMLLRNAPVLSGLNPSTAQIGDPSFELYVSGVGLVQNESVIVFAGQDEPTQFNVEDGTVSTGVNMGVWHGADVVEVRVRNGTQLSEPLEFTFTAAPEAAAASVPDHHDHEHDDDESGYDDDGKPVRKSKARHKK